MNTFEGEVVVEVKVTAYNLEDALEFIYDEFGPGINGAIEVIETRVDSLE